jgi:hypothetical protein
VRRRIHPEADPVGAADVAALDRDVARAVEDAQRLLRRAGDREAAQECVGARGHLPQADPAARDRHAGAGGDHVEALPEHDEARVAAGVDQDHVAVDRGVDSRLDRREGDPGAAVVVDDEHGGRGRTRRERQEREERQRGERSDAMVDGASRGKVRGHGGLHGVVEGPATAPIVWRISVTAPPVSCSARNPAEPPQRPF